MAVEIIRPTLEFEHSYVSYIQELGDEERYPFPLDFDYADFRALLRRLANISAGIDLPEGFVPSSTFWLVDGNELIGVSNLRHYLNDRIRQVGGHIGLGVRPSYRGQGHGNTLLAWTIQEARSRGIAPIHVHCHKHNIPSSKMIIRGGGILESEVNYEGAVVQRYYVAA